MDILPIAIIGAVGFAVYAITGQPAEKSKAIQNLEKEEHPINIAGPNPGTSFADYGAKYTDEKLYTPTTSQADKIEQIKEIHNEAVTKIYDRPALPDWVKMGQPIVMHDSKRFDMKPNLIDENVRHNPNAIPRIRR